MNSLVVIREQSKDPEVATAALRTFAEWLGRGFAPVVKEMSLVERQNDALLRIFAQPGVAQQIRMGLNPQLVDMGDIPPEVPTPVPLVPEPAPAPVFPKKRKRKPPEDLSKFQFRLQDFDSDDDLLQLRRRPLKRKRKCSPKRKKAVPKKRKGARPAWMKGEEEEQKWQPTPKRRRVSNRHIYVKNREVACPNITENGRSGLTLPPETLYLVSQSPVPTYRGSVPATQVKEAEEVPKQVY